MVKNVVGIAARLKADVTAPTMDENERKCEQGNFR